MVRQDGIKRSITHAAGKFTTDGLELMMCWEIQSCIRSIRTEVELSAINRMESFYECYFYPFKLQQS